MRALSCTACFALAIGLCAVSIARGDDNVGWGSSIPTAQRMAAESNRLVLIHFWSPSCKPCMRLDADVFSQGNVGRAIQAEYVPVKINADFSPSTAVQYGVTSLPTDVIVAPSGQVITKFNSPLNAAQYMEQLHQVATNARSGLPVASAAAPPATAATVPWNSPNVGQGMVTPTAGTQPAASGFPAAASSSPLFAGAPGAPAAAAPVGSAPGSAAPVGAAAAPGTGPAANSSPYSNDRYTDYLRQRSGQPAAAPTQQAAAPTASAPPAWPVQPAAAPAAAPGGQTPTHPWAQQQQQQAPVANQPAGQPAGIAAAQPPAGNPPLGLDGYCPVRLREEYKWVMGDRRWGAIHRGRTYLFTGEAERQKFLANPDVYSPVMAGNDPVLAFEQGQGIPGTRKLGVFYGEGPAARVYMFSGDESLKRFWENPERYATEIRQAEAAGRGPIR